MMGHHHRERPASLAKQEGRAMSVSDEVFLRQMRLLNWNLRRIAFVLVVSFCLAAASVAYLVAVVIVGVCLMQLGWSFTDGWAIAAPVWFIMALAILRHIERTLPHPDDA
jgi:hypothetical protein